MSETKSNSAQPGNQFEKYIVKNHVTVWPTFGKMNSDFVSPTPELGKVIEGARPNYAIYYVQRAGMFGEPPHSHTNDEYLVFISSDPHDMKNLGATVEVAFGEDWEKVEFSTSCVVKFPKGIQHCPIHVKKFERPFLFGHLWPMAEKTNMIPAK